VLDEVRVGPFTDTLAIDRGFVIVSGEAIDGGELEDRVVRIASLTSTHFNECFDRNGHGALMSEKELNKLRDGDEVLVIHNATRVVDSVGQVKHKGSEIFHPDPLIRLDLGLRGDFGRGGLDRGGRLGGGRHIGRGRSGGLAGGLGGSGGLAGLARGLGFLGLLGGLLRGLLALLLGGAGGILLAIGADLDLLGQEELAGLDEVEHGRGAGGATELGDDALDVGFGEVGEIERLEFALGVLADVAGDHGSFVTAVVVDLALHELDARVGLLDASDLAREDVGDLDGGHVVLDFDG
jgi:hypothetical protein